MNMSIFVIHPPDCIDYQIQFSQKEKKKGMTAFYSQEMRNIL
jgi:hypothetical protein